MNHIAIVVSQLKHKAERLRAELAGVESAIKALGGTVGGGVPSSQKRRSRGKGAAPATRTRAPRKQAANGELLPPALAAELAAIKADASLSPIQKAQASRKARLAAAKAPVRPEGAVLSEAAAAS